MSISLARAVCLSLMLVAAFWQVIVTMVSEWIHLEEMGHGLFVPFVAAWVVWSRRKELAGIAITPSLWGPAIMGLAFVLLTVATLGADHFLARSSFLLGVMGIVVTVYGWRMVRGLTFPFVLLFFMVRWPSILYSQITLPLQNLASSAAETGLGLLGIPVLREGNVLELPSQRLSVVEACSGIRSLLSLSFLSLVYGYLVEKRAWVRAMLFLAAIPIAIGTNSMRIVITGVFSEYKREWADGVYHQMEGWGIFLIALGMLVLLHVATNRFVPEKQAKTA